MNKYMGFYELKQSGLPSVHWQTFSSEVNLDNNLLWTLRVAVEKSNDLNLPRVVGASSEEAYQKGRELLQRYQDSGLVIYYPYFIAEKSGVMEVNYNHIVIEAVNKDLWNLVTHGNKDVTIIIKPENTEIIGDENFLKQNELSLLLENAQVIKHKFRDILIEGKSVFAEWSFAYNTDKFKNPTGEKYLVFYELRSVE